MYAVHLNPAVPVSLVGKKAQQACYDAGALEVITNIKIHSKTPEATDTFCTYDRGVTKANHMFVDEK